MNTKSAVRLCDASIRVSKEDPVEQNKYVNQKKKEDAIQTEELQYTLNFFICTFGGINAYFLPL